MRYSPVKDHKKFVHLKMTVLWINMTLSVLIKNRVHNVFLQSFKSSHQKIKHWSRFSCIILLYQNDQLHIYHVTFWNVRISMFPTFYHRKLHFKPFHSLLFSVQFKMKSNTFFFWSITHTLLYGAVGMSRPGSENLFFSGPGSSLVLPRPSLILAWNLNTVELKLTHHTLIILRLFSPSSHL
jgi:hypothetical protein